MDTAVVSPPKMGLAAILSSLAINLLALAMPLVILQVFDRVIPFESYATLTLLFFGLCLVAVLDFVLKWARAVTLCYQGERFERDLGDRFMKRSLNADTSDYGATSTGVHFERLNALAQLRDYYSGQARLLPLDLPFSLIFIAMIGLIGGWLILVPLASVVILFAFKSILQRAQGPIFEKRKELDGRRYSFLIECLSQIATVKSDTLEPQLLRRYELLQEQSVDISHRLIQFSGFSQSFGALFSQAAVAAMGLLGGYLVIKGHIGIAELAACMLLNGRTVQPLLKMLSHWAQTESVAMARSKIDEVASLKQRLVDIPFRTDLKGHLSFDSVSLRHPGQSEDLFSDISLDLPEGQVLSVLGEAGAGKGSFLKLILGEVHASKGSVRIDRRPIGIFTNTRGRHGIVYVDRAPAIFQGTILENISGFGDGEAIKIALEVSTNLGLEKIVHRLPQGYNTLLGQGGSIMENASLLQLIALTRALALQPKILLMNNATSAMDESAVLRVAQYFAERKGDCTILLNSASRQLLDLADQSVLLASHDADAALVWDMDLADEKRDAEQHGRRSA